MRTTPCRTRGTGRRATRAGTQRTPLKNHPGPQPSRASAKLVNAASAYLNATEGASRDKALCYGVAKDIVSVLAPICPFWADELWHEALGCEGNAYTAAWPEFDLAESIEDTVQIVVQVLGKVRGRIDVARDASNEEMQAAAEEAVTKWLEGKTVVKAICVPGKLVNLVVK